MNNPDFTPKPEPVWDAPLCSGTGQYHSETNKRDPRPYDTITPREIGDRLNNPQQVEKGAARWAIPSTLLSREFSAQRERGRYVFLWLDIDEPNGRTFEESMDLVQQALPAGTLLLGYTTRSATKDCQKLRVIVPLSCIVTGAEYQLLAAALNDRIEAAGLEPDRATERCAQLCYLPNRGAFYAAEERGWCELDPEDLSEDVEELKRAQAVAQAARDAERREREERRRQGRTVPAELSPIEAFRQEYPGRQGTLDLLAEYGAEIVGKDRAVSPLSDSGMPGIVVFEDGRWFSHHASDAEAGLGVTPEDGEVGRTGDQFDLLAFFEHDNDRNAALRALGDRYTTPEGLTLTEANRQRKAREAFAATTAVDPFGTLDPPPFPTDLLPDSISAFVNDQADLLGVDPAVIAMPALGVAAALIDDRQQIQPKRHDTGWLESARLWVGIIGDPSAMKTPGMRKAMGPAYQINKEWRQQTAELHEQWEQRCSALEEGEAEPVRPAERRLIVEDITTEALGAILERSEPRGVLVATDELSGWLQSHDCYRGKPGKDRPAWLEAYNGVPKVIDRIGRGSLYVQNWSAGVIGGIQPSVVNAYAKATDHDGMLQRFLLIHAREAEMGNDRPPDEAARDRYYTTLQRLPRAFTGGPVTLSEGAHEHREDLDTFLHRAVRATSNKFLAAALGKWRGTFARLLLTFHCIECAESGEHPSTVEVSSDTAERVSRLMRGTLLPHAVKFFSGLDSAESNARSVALLILARGWERFTVRRDLHQNMRASRTWRDDETAAVMGQLEGWGWITPEPGKLDHRGRPAAYAVNPEVHQRFSAQAQRERDRRREEAALLAEIAGSERAA